MSNIEVKQQNAMTEEFAAELGDFHVDNSDILIPKILLMQPSSEFVADGKAAIGDFMHSVEQRKLGSIVEPFEFIPFYHVKIWDIVDVDDQKTWLRSEPFKAGDDALPWDFVGTEGDEAGKNLQRIKRLNFFGFMPSEVEKGAIIPMVLSFRSTGYKEGTKILTQWKMNISKRVVPWNNSFVISGTKVKNEKNQTYCIPRVQILPDPVSHEMSQMCFQWFKDIKSLSVKVDDSDLKEEATKSVAQDIDDTGRF